MFIFDILFWAGVQRCLYLINTQLTLLPLSLALLWTWPLSRHTQPFYSQRTQKPTIILHKHPSQGAAWMHTGLLYFKGLSELLFLDLKKKEQKFDWKTKKMFVRIQSRSPTHGHHHYGIFISSLQQTVLVQVVFFFPQVYRCSLHTPGDQCTGVIASRMKSFRCSTAARRSKICAAFTNVLLIYNKTIPGEPNHHAAVSSDKWLLLNGAVSGCWLSFSLNLISLNNMPPCPWYCSPRWSFDKTNI